MKLSDEDLKDLFQVQAFPLNDKGMYEGFWQDIGYNRKWFDPTSTYWWVEDLVVDTLRKEKVFGDEQIIPTRHLTGRDRGSLGAVFKGPISCVDLWMPGYGFAEIKYTGDSQRDQWGYDLNSRSIHNLYSILSLEQTMSHEMWKNNKLFLIVVHEPNLGDRIAISVIDLKEKFEFNSPWSKKKASKPILHPNLKHVNVSVAAENCLARFDDVPYRKYYNRCHEEK